MLDHRLRVLLGPTLDRLAAGLVRAGVGPGVVTLAGLLTALGAAFAAGVGAWLPALALWLVSRLLDGLDGPVARRSARDGDLGGFLDLMADFVAYSAFVVGCAIGMPAARVPALVLLLTYYLNGTSLLAVSSAAERRGLHDDLDGPGRTFVFLQTLAEGTETIVAHALFVLWPAGMATTMWVFAAVVGVSVLQRIAVGVHTLR